MEVAEIASSLGLGYVFLGDHDRAEEHLARALDVAESLGVASAICRVFAGRAIIASARGHPEEALAYAKHCLDVALDHEDWERVYNAYFNLSDLTFQRDRYEEALGYLRADLEVVRRRGSRPGEWSVLAEMTYPLYMLGRWDEALATAADVPEEHIRDALTLSMLTSVLEIHVHRGDPAEARRILALFEYVAEATDVQDRAGYESAKASVLRRRGSFLRGALGRRRGC